MLTFHKNDGSLLETEKESLEKEFVSSPALVSEPTIENLSDKEVSQESKQIPFLAAPQNKKKTYEGDARISDEETVVNAKTLEFPNPAILINLFMDNLREGKTKLHDWQRDLNIKLANKKPTSKNPYKFALCACNGSGKDKYIIAPFAVWFCCAKKKSRCIITSASGTQLTSQTESYIRALCMTINEWTTQNFGGPVFKINQRFIYGIHSGSEIRLFATDEEGKAEGYHPIEDDAEMAMIVNEAKSVTPEIYRALRRCTGFNYWIDVSSPGEPLGDFYEHFISSNWESLKVDYTLCPHHSDQERQEDFESLGIENYYYRSKWLAEFTSHDSCSVIPTELVNRIRVLTKEGKIPYKKGPKRVGIDLAGGGDENSCFCLEGNTVHSQLNFREKDTTITAKRVDNYLNNELNLPKDYELIFADDGGIGKAIIDMLNAPLSDGGYGWNIRRVNNQSAATDTGRYLNRGAQNWYRGKKLLEQFCFRLEIQNDPELFYKQLSNRFCKQDGNQGKLALEPKPQARAHGRPSPDRADAFILALTGTTKDDFLEAGSLKSSDIPNSSGKERKLVPNTVADLTKWNDEQTTREYEGRNLFDSRPSKGSRTRYSLNEILRQQLNVNRY